MISFKKSYLENEEEEEHGSNSYKIGGSGELKRLSVPIGLVVTKHVSSPYYNNQSPPPVIDDKRFDYLQDSLQIYREKIQKKRANKRTKKNPPKLAQKR